MSEKFFFAAEDFAENFLSRLKSLRPNFVEEILRDELEGGRYGSEAKNFFCALTTDEQKKILRALRLQELSGGRELKFSLAARKLFPDAKIFFNAGKFLIWLPEKKSDAALKKIELIKILFMDLSNAEFEIFFERSFGVFGSPATLQLDEMILY